MNLLFIGMTMSVIGKGLLALGIIWVHVTMANERRIDDLVIRSFRTELIVTITGFALILVGYMIEVSAFGGFQNFASCVGPECTGAALNALIK